MAGSVDVMEMYLMDHAESVARRRDNSEAAADARRAAHGYDMRALGAFIAEQMFRSDNPSYYGDLNAGIRVPTTLDHPNAKVGA